jgi:methylglutaconyl-CoA hydratase
VAAAKQLPDLALLPIDEAALQTVRIIAGLRVGEEGQEGMSAFFDKRQPAWVPEAPDAAQQ